MSSKKRPDAFAEIWTDFAGRKFANNSTNNRVNLIERMYIRILTELASNRFKWEGLPPEIDLRLLELTLFRQALSVFYFDKKYDKYFALPGAGTNWNSITDNPVGFSIAGGIEYMASNVSAVRDTERARKAIPIWSNYLRMPDSDIVYIYANRLAELDRTIEINSDNARQSKVLIMSENQKLSVTNIDRQISEGQNGIKIGGPLGDMQFVQALDLGINPDSLEKLHILKVREWNECMGYLGIENANQDKKERLVASEVDANNDQTSMTRFVNLNARRIAAKEISEYYEMDVTVRYYTDEERQRLANGNDEDKESEVE